MKGWEIAILVVVCVAFVVAVGIIIYNKIKGKSSCDCGGSCGSESNGTSCGGCCSHCAMCLGAKHDASDPDKTGDPS